MLHTVYLAAEDEPGLAIGRRLVAEASPLEIYHEENGHGFGKLRTKTRNYQQIGMRMPVLMITDLDAYKCPSELIKEWLDEPRSAGFLFRICVREVEAWLLAHRSAISNFLKISEIHLPDSPETLLDPKAELIRLAQRAPRKIRIGLTPVGSATIGPDYNAMLSEFIRDTWSPAIAATQSPSLMRARLRLKELAASVSV